MKSVTLFLAPILLWATLVAEVVAKPKPPKLPGIPVSESTYDDFVRYAQFIHSVEASPCAAPDASVYVEGINTEHVKGFLFANARRQQLIFAFPGAHGDDLDILLAVNNDFNTVKYPYCKGCLVRSKFYSLWQGISGLVRDEIQRAMNDHPGYSLVLAGHSLGGAMAEFAYADLQATYSPTLYTYGVFRLGNKKYANYMDSIAAAPPPFPTPTVVNNRRAARPAGRHFRVTYANDYVPKIISPAQFSHWGTEHWISDASAPKAATTYQCAGQEPKTCINSQMLDSISGMIAHNNYPGLNYDCGLCGGKLCLTGEVCEENTCRAPQCVNGGYSCSNSNSGDFTCNNNDTSSCYCFQTVSGGALCGETAYCIDLQQNCESDAECANGSYCSPNTCCGVNVCIPFGVCGNGANPSKLFAKQRKAGKSGLTTIGRV